jgi:hypothetical protein
MIQEGSSAPPLTIAWLLTITGGTGTYAGATGSALYAGQLIEIGASSGTLAGSFDLPSA